MSYDRRRSLPVTRPENTTRLMCSGVLINRDLAESLHTQLCKPTVRVLAPWPGIDLVILARYAAWGWRQRLRREAGLLVALLGTIGLVAAFCLTLDVIVLVAAALTLSAGWLWRVRCDHRLTKTAIAALANGDLWDPGPGILSDEREAYLSAVPTANVSIYSRDRDDPFPGLGDMGRPVVMQPVDISRRADKDTPIVPFKASDVHDHVVRAAPRFGLEELSARHVLYVAGEWVDEIDRLLAGPTDVPVLRVHDDLIRQVIDEPREHLRSYVCIQRVAHGGSLVTSVNVRVRLVGKQLSWETITHVLGPPSQAYVNAARIPSYDITVLRHALRRNREKVVVQMLHAPVRLASLAWALRAESRLRQPRHMKWPERLDPYGASETEREFAARDSETELFAGLDARDQFQRVFRGVYRAMVAFLRDHNVDVAELVRTETSVVYQTVNSVFGDVGQAMFGDNQSATMTNVSHNDAPGGKG
jgi:hypothetical protein